MPNEEKWENFNSETFSIFELNGMRNGSLQNLFKLWMEKHEFWYDKFPNDIYNKCLESHKNGSIIYLVNWVLLFFQSIWFSQIW